MYNAEVVDLVIWQALAGLGSCSLNVSLPVAVHCKLQAVPLASAVLSSHGAYAACQSYSCAPLLAAATKQYKALGLQPRVLLVGYLADLASQAAVYDFKEAFPDCLLFLDPVLGDNGRIYSKLNQELVKGMQNLLPLADLIFPNLTEAALLLSLESDYFLNLTAQENNLDKLLTLITPYLQHLQSAGAKRVLLKGLKYVDPQSQNNHICNVLTATENGNNLLSASAPWIDFTCAGSGDFFAAVLTCKYLQTANWQTSLTAASTLSSRLMVLTQAACAQTEDSALYLKNKQRGVALELLLQEWQV